mmetsp:Transcript_26211/g.82949  ORF Transcript_26211/g.82949 Transcript_26211/m.82949 type:complete len:224 (-) Transcript_26211:253-924(-)
MDRHLGWWRPRMRCLLAYVLARILSHGAGTALPPLLLQGPLTPEPAENIQVEHCPEPRGQHGAGWLRLQAARRQCPEQEECVGGIRHGQEHHELVLHVALEHRPGSHATGTADRPHEDEHLREPPFLEGGREVHRHECHHDYPQDRYNATCRPHRAILDSDVAEAIVHDCIQQLVRAESHRDPRKGVEALVLLHGLPGEVHVGPQCRGHRLQLLETTILPVAL